MELIAVFEETDMSIPADFQELDSHISADFGAVAIVNEIPKEYGLITYDQNKVITVS